MLLNVKDLCVSYGSVDAVHGLDMAIADGEIVALLGANGAGKSSTLNAIVGLEPIKSGEVVFDGSSIANVPTEQIVRSGLTLTPEGRRVFGSLMVEENLLLGGYVVNNQNGDRNRNLERVFDIFPILADRRLQLAGTLSGGQQQQLAIGRSLMSSPKLLLLDEPSLGLAPQIVEMIFELIVSLRENGITILLVEQNVAMSLEIADRGYLMASGSIMTSGTVEELTASKIIEEAYLGHE